MQTLKTEFLKAGLDALQSAGMLSWYFEGTSGTWYVKPTAGTEHAQLHTNADLSVWLDGFVSGLLTASEKIDEAVTDAAIQAGLAELREWVK